jgi:hypothetical protein
MCPSMLFAMPPGLADRLILDDRKAALNAL